MHDFPRQRRNLFLTSFAFAAALWFEVSGTELRFGNVSVNFGDVLVIYGVLFIAWVWAAYRFWMIWPEVKPAAAREFRKQVRQKSLKKVRAAFRLLAGTLYKQKFLSDHDVHENDVEFTLQSRTSMNAESDQTTASFDWSATYMESGRRVRKTGTVEAVLSRDEYESLLRPAKWNIGLRKLYLSDFWAPVAAAALPVIVAHLKVWPCVWAVGQILTD